MKKLLFSILLAYMSLGCANLVIRPHADYNCGPYYCTAQISKGIGRGLDGKPVEQMFLPVMFIDWPFDALADTLLWPWDAYWYSRRMNESKKRR